MDMGIGEIELYSHEVFAAQLWHVHVLLLLLDVLSFCVGFLLFGLAQFRFILAEKPHLDQTLFHFAGDRCRLMTAQRCVAEFAATDKRELECWGS